MQKRPDHAEEEKGIIKIPAGKFEKNSTRYLLWMAAMIIIVAAYNIFIPTAYSFNLMPTYYTSRADQLAWLITWAVIILMACSVVRFVVINAFLAKHQISWTAVGTSTYYFLFIVSVLLCLSFLLILLLWIVSNISWNYNY